jgi:hypothetical protein
MHHMLGVLALVPVAMLLTVSFFVLFTREKTEVASLKTFGLVVAVVLWVAAAVILGAGLVGMACWHHGECGKMGMMMNGRGPCGPGMMGMKDMKGKPCAPGMLGQQQTGEPQAAPAKEEKKK